MSKAVTRWFIVVDSAKKRKSLAHPNIGHAWADADLLREHKDLPEDVVNVLPWFPVETHVEDRF
jgi:hypothetical protein